MRPRQYRLSGTSKLKVECSGGSGFCDEECVKENLCRVVEDFVDAGMREMVG